MAKEEPKSWERQPGESSQAWEARRIYIHMGPGRTLERVRAQLEKSWTLISRWSSSWNWVASAREFDAYADKIAQKQAVDAQVERLNAERKKWELRSDQFLDMIYNPFLIASNDLIKAQQSANDTGKLIPYRLKESMIRSIVKTAPLAELAFELARQRRGQGDSPINLHLSTPPDDERMVAGRRLAVLKAFVDYQEPEGESA